ncbi:lipoyl synthase, chloroplastic [Artemisia annua]|uniref:Lipoyl synthase, chloroplastic n=1 Tax=Artemisia annua TaxID=35608 RepID=A0A2U1M5P1_ARTAN|nr:lipoyl synthase, chloroplastic [Artemisia annua]
MFIVTRSTAFRFAVFVGYIEGPYHITMWPYNAFCLPKRDGTTSQCLSVLKHVKHSKEGMITKTFIMLGLGETVDELKEAMDDLHSIDVDILTLEQYLQISGCMTHYVKGKPIALTMKVIHAHKNCTEWSPNVYFEADIAVNLEAELARSEADHEPQISRREKNPLNMKHHLSTFLLRYGVYQCLQVTKLMWNATSFCTTIAQAGYEGEVVARWMLLHLNYKQRQEIRWELQRRGHF